jgi:nitrite reductase/ring-hydroxylating ferredoxin subunit
MAPAITWIKVCSLGDVPAGKAANLYINGQRLVITRHEDAAYVIQGYCSHMLYYFKDAAVENCILTCHLHKSQFDVRDGSVVRWAENVSGKRLEDIKVRKRLRTYATQVRDGQVYVAWPTDAPDKVRVKF